ncbi:NPL4 [Enterospora canceri]|uniref:Nuclear protein localization protein 4 n=1 Tax=Enterospora canceri TaxID=1081671 RepID=A0A1Y1S6H3_9MICR|nr:NPL4 [Enterospora canceri]
MVKVFVYGPWGRLPLQATDPGSLIDKIKNELKITHCRIFKDKERKNEMGISEPLVQGMRLYVVSEKIEKTEVKANLCNHPKEKRCLNCAVEEIQNEEEEKKKREKYLSKATYLEMLKAKGVTEPDYDYRKQICGDHGVNVVCMKCMDKAITLIPQIHRSVDYVEFDTSFYVETFVNAWKNSGRQQLGLLIGKYKAVDGKQRGVVSLIYVPEQANYPDGFSLEKYEELGLMDGHDGLAVLGLIYTDLFLKEGVQHSYKIENNVILSAFELDFFHKMARTISGKGGVRDDLVFVSVSSDREKQIEMSCFLPTKQFHAVMDAKLVGLSTDPTTFVNVSKRELLYMYRNEYNTDVSTKADPYVPVEYFFVTCEVGYSNKSPLFGNRTLDRILISLDKLSGYFDGDYHNMEKYRNLFVLLSLSKFYKKTSRIFQAVAQGNNDQFHAILGTDEFLVTIAQLEKHRQVKWECSTCTFINEAYVTQCDMCGKPKG